MLWEVVLSPGFFFFCGCNAPPDIVLAHAAAQLARKHGTQGGAEGSAQGPNAVAGTATADHGMVQPMQPNLADQVESLLKCIHQSIRPNSYSS